MAQLTNEQWAAMSQEERDRHLRGLVTYTGGTVTGRFTQTPGPVRELQRFRRSYNQQQRSLGYKSFDNVDDLLLDADYAAIERRILESMTPEERAQIEAYEAERKDHGN